MPPPVMPVKQIFGDAGPDARKPDLHPLPIRFIRARMIRTESRRTPDDLDTSDFGARRPAPAVARLIELTRRQPDSWAGRRLSFLLRRLALRRIDGPVDTRAL